MVLRISRLSLILLIFTALLLALCLGGCSSPDRKPSAVQDTGLGTECVQTYSRFFAKDTITIAVAFGYMDTGWGDAANGSMRRSITDTLTVDGDVCRDSLHPHACGFNSGNPNLLTKKIRGPDGAVKTIQIRFVDAINEAASENSSQTQVTSDAETEFLTSLNHDDVLFYLGHSRDGGGPDFNPPKLLANGDRNYAWYKRNQPGFKAIEDALAKSKEHTKLLALLSCDSGMHFAERIKELAPETALIVSEAEVEFIEQEHSLIGAIDGLLGMKCRDDFMKDLQFVDVTSGKNPAGILQLIGFFE
jgi:hypothetical protein